MGSRMSSGGGGGGGGGSGTVTSVALSVPAELSVSGSPVTSAGTLAVTKASASPNAVYAGPSSGGAAQPSMRALVAADIGAVNPSALVGSGTVPLAGLSGITHSQLDAAAGILAAQIAAVNPSALTGAGTVPLAALGGLTTSQLSASAGLVAGQIASVNPSALTGSGTVPLAALAGTAPVRLGQVVVGAGGSASVDFNSIAAGYSALQLLIFGTSSAAAASVSVLAQFNADSTAGHYADSYFYSQVSFSGPYSVSTSAAYLGDITAQTAQDPALATSIVASIAGYSSTAFKKSVAVLQAVSNAAYNVIAGAAFWKSTAAITSVHLFLSGGSFTEGTTITLYGLP